MKIRVHEDNINTKDYFEKYYSKPDWRREWDGADLRLSQALELIDTKYPKHLDIGCADGTFTKYYLEKFPDTQGWGCDISETVINLATKNCPNGIFVQADCYQLPYSDSFFDLVHCAEMIEHIDYPELALKEMYRVLKKGGTLIVTTPNELADEYTEHLWRWDIYGVRQMIESNMNKEIIPVTGFTIIDEKPSFHNGHIMYIKAKKP